MSSKELNKPAAIYVEGSKNSKLGGMDSSYTSIEATCSSTCPMKINRTCYGISGYTGIVNARLNGRAEGLTALQIASQLAKSIDASYKGNAIPSETDLRLQTIGDSRTVKGTKLIANALTRWKKRGGRDAFTFTHSWKNVKRKTWGQAISILGSIENIGQVKAVRKAGYAPALVVDYHPSTKAFKIEGCDTTFIPCPEQTKGITCRNCRLCMRGDWLKETNRGIAFAAHGSAVKQLRHHLTVIK